MSAEPIRKGHSRLLLHLRWLTRLRWVAAATLVAGALIDVLYLRWYLQSRWMLILGSGLLIYNGLMELILKRMWLGIQSMGSKPPGRLGARELTWIQLLVDLGCLSMLAAWTGGPLSPLLSFFVFHMVFSSVLLARSLAYLGAAAALAMLASTLLLSGQFPGDRVALLVLVGIAVTLFFTVYLTNHLVGALHRGRARLMRKNRRIRSITRQLRRHQQALIQQEKLNAIGQLAAGVGHEVANPLANMDGLLQLMERWPDRQRPDAIARLRQQIQRISDIVAQLKDFAHPVEMRRARMPIGRVIDQALDFLSLDPRMKRVEVVREYDAALGEVDMVPQAIQQVMVNLIANALDATQDSPHPRLVVRAQRQQGDCVVEVIDNGQGIPTELQSRLFEPFFTTKPVGKGTGLGLSISYNLLKKQGGVLWASSTPGQGATFAFRLPLQATPSRDREAQDPSLPKAGNPIPAANDRP